MEKNRAPHPHLPRPALVAHLLRHRIAAVVAPAGYGKTILLREALQAAGPAVVWYRLREGDREPAQLLAGLLGASGAPSPEAPSVAAPAPPDAVALLRERFGGRPLTLALDCVEALQGADASCRLLAHLISGGPSDWRLLMAGRTMPSIPGLGRLRLEGEATELGARDLLLSDAESRELLGALGAPTLLADLASGWLGPLRLLANRAEIDWDELFSYIEGEIMLRLPADEQRLLLDLGALEAWHPPACNWLLDRTDAAQLLAQWQRTLPVDRNGEVHPLMRRYLSARLHREPDRSRGLHRRLALWEMERGEPRHALRYALAAADVGLTTPLFRQVGADLLATGQLAELAQWLERVPTPVLEAAPDLLLQAGEAIRRGGSPRQAVRWLRMAALGFAGAGESGGLLRAFCRLALAHSDLGEWSEVEAAIRQIEAEVADAAGRDRAEALRVLAEQQVRLGQSEAAAARFEESVALYLAHGDPQGAGAALAGWGAGALVALGRLNDAVATLREAQGLLTGAEACEAALAESWLLMEQGRWEEAALAVGGAAPGTPLQGARRAWTQARLALEQDDLSAARRLREEGERLLEQGERRPGAHPVALLLDGWLALTANEQADAVAHGRQANRLAIQAGSPLLRLAAARLLAACESAPDHGSAPQMTPEPEALAAAGALMEAGRPESGLRAECLGAFRLYEGAREIPSSHWGRAQVRAMLQYLLLQPGFAASRETLLETFWPEEAPSQSRSRLRVGINRLRQALRPLGVTLTTHTDTIALPQEAVVSVDLLLFRDHLEGARAAVRQDPERCVKHCRAGRLLYRGPLLADSFWPGVERYRQQVHTELAELLWLWQEAAMRVARAEEAVTALSELVALEPGNEEAARQLINLLIRSGRRGEAMRLYRDLARWLKAELGLDPSPQTQSLVRRALHG